MERDLRFGIPPPGFALVGHGDTLEDSPHIGMMEMELLGPGAVFRSELALLFTAFSP